VEPELLRLEPSLETYESPFLAQNIEMTAYLKATPEHWGKAPGDADDRHLRVLLGQCQDVIERVRNTAARDGTSIRLTYHLQRLRQLLRRSEQLLDILAGVQGDRSGIAAYPPIVKLSMQLTCDECLRDNLRPPPAPEHRADRPAGDRQRQPAWRPLHHRDGAANTGRWRARRRLAVRVIALHGLPEAGCWSERRCRR
jgi:hypothetical protein